MSLVIPCPGCNSPLHVREEYAGKKVKCPKCSQLIPIPAADLPSPTEVVPDPSTAPPPVDHGIAEVRPLSRGTPPPPAPAAADDVSDVTEVVPAPPQRTQTCRSCQARNPAHARRCRSCDEPLGRDEDEDDERRPRRRDGSSAFAPCPRCGVRDARRVTWTPWGSFYGPAMFSHVRCLSCGYAFNGRTGRSNLIPAILFVTIPAILILAIVVGLFWVVIASGRR